MKKKIEKNEKKIAKSNSQMIVKIHPFTSEACVTERKYFYLFIFFSLFVCWFVCQEYYYGKNENNSMHGTIFYDDKRNKAEPYWLCQNDWMCNSVMLFVLLELNFTVSVLFHSFMCFSAPGATLFYKICTQRDNR